MNTAGRIRTERRLAAILAADVAGYSRLIGVVEEGTREPAAGDPFRGIVRKSLPFLLGCS